MTDDHTPDQELMDRVCSILNRGPMTVAGITIALPSEPKVSPQQVRQALHDLMHYGKVVRMTDGKQYRLSDKPVINGKGVA